jgi:hypothetical protein
MKDFSRPRGRLGALPLAARAVYSIFLVLTLLGLGLTAWLTQDMVGEDLGRLSEYYAGTSTASAERPPSRGGPHMELPPEAELVPVAEPIPLRKLLEVTHFHLFSMPVYLMILSHLFLLSTLTTRAKITWIAVATLATTGHIAAPWVARAAPTGSAAFCATSGGLLALSFIVMSLVPLWEMWRPAPHHRTDMPPGSEALPR